MLTPNLPEMPTVMNAWGELTVIRALRAVPLGELVENRDAFVELVNRLDESHAGGGSFGLTPHNQVEFHAFADWLRDVGPSVGLAPDREWALDVTFDQMASSIPGMAEEAASTPRPGTPLVRHLADQVAAAGPFLIEEAHTSEQGFLRLGGDGWVFSAPIGWRVLALDRTVAFSWLSPGRDGAVADLKGLSIVEVAGQGQLMTADPRLRLSDDRWIEVFSGDPLTPWSMRLPSGYTSGAPALAEWI